MKILFWIIALPILALVGAFAAVNHAPVTLRLWPLPYEMVIPVYGAVLGAFVLGFFIAGLWVWIAALPARIGRHRHARHEKKLEEEVTELREELEKTKAEAERARERERQMAATPPGMIAGAD